MSQINVNNIRAKDGVSAVGFPGGINATGVVTATSFLGNLTGNVTGTASLASNLTGTPNITVGTVTGTDATFSGNLTVNGTTTTIDTAVTAVDSLAVDGNITALGRLGIGTDNTSAEVLTVSGVDAFIRVDRSNNNPGIDLRYQGSSTNRGVIDVTTTGDLRFATGGSTERVRITSGGTAIFKAGLAEKFNNVGTTLATTTNHAITDGNVILFTGNEPSAGRTLGITGVHSILAVGESFSVTAIISPNGTGTIGGITIEGAGQTIQWSGGSAPSAGASGRDVYTFTFLKTGSANTNYEVFGAATNYA